MLEAHKDPCKFTAIRELGAESGSQLTTSSEEDDHTCLLVRYPPKVALSRLVNSPRTYRAAGLERRPEMSGHYVQDVPLSPSYFVAPYGGAALSVIADHVRSQQEDALPPRPERRGFRVQG